MARPQDEALLTQGKDENDASAVFSPCQVYCPLSIDGRQTRCERGGYMLGARIAALRREANLSQAELASRLQVSPSALGMYEQGRREPSMETLVRLSRELGVTTDYLLTGAPAEPESSELNEMLLSRIRAADQRLEQRQQRPFSREELAVLFAAMLIEREE